MSSIIIRNVANHAPVISRRGTDNVFAELSFERTPAGMIELICTIVRYDEFTGAYDRNEIGWKIVEEEEAVDAACDLEWDAVQRLDETNSRGTIERLGFGEAAEAELTATYAIAAE